LHWAEAPPRDSRFCTRFPAPPRFQAALWPFRERAASPITAAQDGNSVYAAAAPIERSFVTTKIDQTLAFAALPDCDNTHVPIALAATVSSALPPQFSVSGPATIAGNVLSLTGVGGVVTVTASQSGSAFYNPATPVTRSFVVNAVPIAEQELDFAPLADRFKNTPPFALNPSSSSGLPVTLQVVSGPAIVSGFTVTLTGSTGTVCPARFPGGFAGHGPRFP